MKTFVVPLIIMMLGAAALGSDCTPYLTVPNFSQAKLIRAYEQLIFEHGRAVVSDQELVHLLRESKNAPEKLFELSERGDSRQALIQNALTMLLNRVRESKSELPALVAQIRERVRQRLTERGSGQAKQNGTRQERKKPAAVSHVVVEQAIDSRMVVTPDNYLFEQHPTLGVRITRISDGQIVASVSELNIDGVKLSFNKKYWAGFKRVSWSPSKFVLRIYQMDSDQMLHEAELPGSLPTQLWLADDGSHILFQNDSSKKFFIWSADSKDIQGIEDLEIYESLFGNYFGERAEERELRETLASEDDEPNRQPWVETSWDGKIIVRKNINDREVWDGFRILDRSSGQVRRLDLGKHSQTILNFAISADARLLFVSSRDDKIHIFDTQSGLKLREIAGVDSAIFKLADQDRVLLTRQRPNKIIAWDLSLILKDEER